MPLPSYSLEDLHKRFLSDKKFLRLFNEWVDSGFDKQFKPSIDRINNFKPYNMDNIHMLTWAENSYKQRMEFKRIRAKKVYMIMGTKVIREFRSVSHAIKETSLHQGNISSCLHGKRNHVGGYKFSYENPELNPKAKATK